MSNSVYFDESGNSGYIDFINNTLDFNFSGNNYFCLCGINVNNNYINNLNDDLINHGLCNNYKSELKSGEIFLKDPEFLIKILRHSGLFFEPYIEVVDKRYLISCSITQFCFAEHLQKFPHHKKNNK